MPSNLIAIVTTKKSKISCYSELKIADLVQGKGRFLCKPLYSNTISYSKNNRKFDLWKHWLPPYFHSSNDLLKRSNEMHKNDGTKTALGPNGCHMCYLLIGKRKSVAEVLILLSPLLLTTKLLLAGATVTKSFPQIYSGRYFRGVAGGVCLKPGLLAFELLLFSVLSLYSFR